MAVDGLAECRAMLKDAVKGKYLGYLLEGMACPGGCVGGAGTLGAVSRCSRSGACRFPLSWLLLISTTILFQSLLEPVSAELNC